MGKWGALAQQTYLDIKNQKIKDAKHTESDCTAVIVNNIYRIRKRIRRY